MRGEIQCRLWPRDDSEKKFALEMGHRLDKTLGINELVHGDNVFFAATGITDGELLRGVHYLCGGATTDSLVMRSRSGTIRRIQATHRFEKLMQISQVD